jgi:TonB family protein
MVASAIDIHGKRHIGSLDFPGLPEPWMRDRIAYTPPSYPFDARNDRSEGDGLFRIFIDPKTGLVTRVLVARSTGYDSLDRSAISAIKKWRWKPQTWKQVDTPIRFTMRRAR